MSMRDLQTIIKKQMVYGNVRISCVTTIYPKMWKELKCAVTKIIGKNILIYKTGYYEKENCTSKLIRNILVSKLFLN